MVTALALYQGNYIWDGADLKDELPDEFGAFVLVGLFNQQLSLLWINLCIPSYPLGGGRIAVNLMVRTKYQSDAAKL